MKPRKTKKKSVIAMVRYIAAVAACMSFVPLTAMADVVSDFYTGKTVRIVVGYSPGGGYDLYARTLAKYFRKQIPGRPALVVQNMPGAGSLRAVKQT
jgi:tripartite-type tricarboxylate transporter receptor subunit TctC